MSDKFSRMQRSALMSIIKTRDTSCELPVRHILKRLGVSFKTHVSNLPGTPDVVFQRKKKVIFVNGCFWHGHVSCRRGKRPTSRSSFWNKKIDGNIRRDNRIRYQLRRLGWRVLTIW